MKTFFWIVFLIPVLAWAETPECGKEFFKGVAPQASPTVPNSQFLCFSDFALLHSSQSKTPVWVSEHLWAERIQNAKRVPRKNLFHPEKSLEPGKRAELSDYVRTGYARGHMAPSGDMSTAESQKESFSLANMVPQNSRNNSGPWKGIEDAIRKMALDGDDIYVVTGPIYPSKGPFKTIGENEVMVPEELYKAVYNATTREAGAYILSNEAKPSCEKVSIAQLKDTTFVDVFPALPLEVKKKGAELPLPSKLECPSRVRQFSSPHP